MHGDKRIDPFRNYRRNTIFKPTSKPTSKFQKTCKTLMRPSFFYLHTVCVALDWKKAHGLPK